MKKTQNISLAKQGMSRDLAVDSLDEQAYGIAVNMNMENESGEQFKLKSEHSNILASKFKAGFKVIGFGTNEIKNETLFLLTNPDTGVSEIGKIRNNREISDLNDVERECPDCNYERVLADPLESTNQPEHQVYETLLTDDCPEAANCLGFDIRYPVKRIVVKNEKLGTKWYWSDGLNPPRYYDEARQQEYLEEGREVCGVDNTTVTCLDCDKLRLFPQYQPLQLEAESIEVGGNLKLGSYTFYVAYADALGQELSEYGYITEAISIFDTNNRIRTNEEADVPTNFAIKLSVTADDLQFSYYKVAVAFTNAVDRGTRYFDVGLYPATQKTILFSTTQDKIETSGNEILRPRQNITTLAGFTEANNHLIGWGVTREKEWNLQPVVNLMGSFFKWSSYQASEEIYEDGVAGAKYKGYFRDEVYPLGIRFITKTGYKTAIFPLIGRPATANDTTVLSNTDVNSLNQAGLNCAGSSRTQRWQVYNTAAEEGSWPTSNVPTNTITEPVSKNSITEITGAEIGQGPGTYTFYDDGPITAMVSAGEEEQSSVFLTLINDAIEDGSCLGALCDTDTSGIADSIPTYDPSCTTPPALVDEFTQLKNVTVAGVNVQYANYPDDYTPMKITNFCDLYVTDASNGNPLEDTDFYDDFSYFNSGNKVFVRTYGFTNDKPRSPLRLSYSNPVEPIQQLYHHTYDGSLVLADLQENNFIGLTTSGQGFSNAIMHKNALWWEIDLPSTPYGIIELPKGINPGGPDDGIALDSYKNARASLWTSNRPTTPITAINSKIYKFTTGTRYYYEYSINSNTGDPQLVIYDENGALIYTNGAYNVGDQQRLYLAIEPNINQEGSVYFIRPSNYCFGVALRDREILQVDVDYQDIVYERIQRYVTPCDFEVPILGDCEGVPYKYGSFAYWQSEEIYPDNAELFDSSALTIQQSDFSRVEDQTKFQDLFATGVAGGQYTLDPTETNFACKNIRHFKFPDNKVSPFMYENPQSGFNSSIVYPLGVHIDDTVIQEFLQIAANNNLITEEQRASIVEYEIYRGDRTLDKGVVARGLLYDMYKYQEQDRDIWFSNFPYNDLGDNRLIYSNDTRTTFVGHPGGSDKSNDKYTFHSPETEFAKPSLPTDLKIEGYMYGKSRGAFEEVEDHPKYVILGPRALQLAKTLATLEVVAEAAVIAAESAEVFRFQVGVSNSANPVGIGLNIAATALNIVGSAVFKYGRYKYQWEQIFRENGDPENFAYYYSSVGDYNYLQTDQTENNWVRGINKANYLGDGRTIIVNEVGSEKIEVNNVKREESVFISLGTTYELSHPISYYQYDNADVDRNQASRTFARDSSACAAGRSPEIVKNIASPYVSLNNFLPSQYGTINSISWLTTTYRGDLENPSNDAKPIFGGDAFIARHTLKRKAPLFLRTAMGLANFTPFNYRSYGNYGEQPTFYGNLLAPDEVTFDRNLPQVRSEYEFDCEEVSNAFYVKAPAKFYLYYYGIPSYLTETTINLNYRIGGAHPKDQYYPLFTDYVEWTQEKLVPISERNVYKYEGVYSSQTRKDISRPLPSTYNKTQFDTLSDSPNGIVFSRPDNNETSLTDPWLTFLPLDKVDFPTGYGNLVEIKGIEREFVLCRFDNNTAIFNAVDSLFDDGSKPETQNLGDGFKRRVVTYYETDLGYGGSQNFSSVSCEMGHFFVDADRGQVFMIPSLPEGPGGLTEISATVNGKPSGMRNWFKEHLPYKVKSSIIENYNDIDIDNPYNGIGIVMGYDSRHKRVFLTKKDYKPLKPMTYTDGEFFDGLTKIELSNTEYFEDVSWTVAFSALTGTWISYYDFHPNYYVNHNNYFQTGINVGTGTTFGLWSHLLTNKSFGVFYGNKYDIMLEYPIKNSFTSKTLERVELWTSGLRYHNEHDFAYNRDINFNEMYILNRREASGKLKLVPQKTLRENTKYPQTNGDTQSILMTNTNDRWNVNYIFNRVLSEYNNQPITFWDENQIKREFNNRAVAFRGKRVLEPLRGTSFMVNLAYNTDSRYQVEFQWATNTEEVR